MPLAPFLALALAAASASAAPDAVPAAPAAARAHPACAAPELSLAEVAEDDIYYIHGSFLTEVPPTGVWGVLSDYEGLRGVISGLSSSRVLERLGPRVLIEQVLSGQFLFFRKTLRLRLQVEEQAPWRIAFANVEARPFRRYEGSWAVEARGAGSRVDYTLSVSRGNLAPLFLERKLFRENSKRLLEEFCQEVLRRSQK